MRFIRALENNIVKYSFEPGEPLMVADDGVPYGEKEE